MSGDANLAYRAAKANRAAALAAALPILVKHQFLTVTQDGLGARISCICEGAHVSLDDERIDVAEAMAQHQIDAVRGGK